MREHLNLYFSLLIFFFLVSPSPLSAEQKLMLSENSEISLLISGSYNKIYYTLHGHAAMRVKDRLHGIDIVFNYGIFDFTAPNFAFKFVKGETDFKFGATEFFRYMYEYHVLGRSVNELVLNLTKEEKQRIWDALLINLLPRNRMYRYNFFYDNCATRLVFLIEMFLPAYLESSFRTAIIESNTGNQRTLVKRVDSLSIFEPEKNFYPPEKITPLGVALFIFIFIASITLYEIIRNKYLRFLDILLFGIAGTAGCALFYISCLSIHPFVFPNWSLVWLHPFHLLGALLIAVKRFSKAAEYYHLINFVVLSLLLAGWSLIPQHMNTAFIPLVLTLWTRSAFAVYRSRKRFFHLP